MLVFENPSSCKIILRGVLATHSFQHSFSLVEIQNSSVREIELSNSK